jgi:hypothetical protein
MSVSKTPGWATPTAGAAYVDQGCTAAASPPRDH